MSAARCESCDAPVPEPKHASAIGGGWADLCEGCAGRLCACGAVVLRTDGAVFHDGDDLHARDYCTDGIFRPRGCPCGACRLEAAGVTGGRS